MRIIAWTVISGALFVSGCCGSHFITDNFESDNYIGYASRTTKRGCDADAPLNFHVVLKDRATEEVIFRDKLVFDGLPVGYDGYWRSLELKEVEDGLEFSCVIQPDEEEDLPKGITRHLTIRYILPEK